MAHEGRCVATQQWQSSHSHTSQPPLSNFGFTRINPATIYFKGIKLEFGVLHLKTSSRLIHSQFHLGTCLPAWSPIEKRENRIVFRFCVSQENNLLTTTNVTSVFKIYECQPCKTSIYLQKSFTTINPNKS